MAWWGGLWGVVREQGGDEGHRERGCGGLHTALKSLNLILCVCASPPGVLFSGLYLDAL